MPDTEIRVLWNTIPVVYGNRDATERAVRDGIGTRDGAWKVTLAEPQNATRWEIGIEGPDGRKWDFAFDGPDQQVGDFTRSAVDRTLP